MKIVILAGDGGSSGLKGHIKGFLSACSVDSTVQVTVICTPQLIEFLHGKAAPNVKLVPLEESGFCVGYEQYHAQGAGKLPYSVGITQSALY